MVCSRSIVPFYIVNYYIICVKTSWTDSKISYLRNMVPYSTCSNQHLGPVFQIKQRRLYNSVARRGEITVHFLRVELLNKFACPSFSQSLRGVIVCWSLTQQNCFVEKIL